jgi:hypothetical protein
MASGEFGSQGGKVFGWDGWVNLAETFIARGFLHHCGGFILYSIVELLFGCCLAAG